MHARQTVGSAREFRAPQIARRFQVFRENITRAHEIAFVQQGRRAPLHRSTRLFERGDLCFQRPDVVAERLHQTTLDLLFDQNFFYDRVLS